MSFTSVTFLLWFGALTAVWYALAPRRRWWAALGASLWFYLALQPAGLPMLLGAALVTWGCALAIQRLHGRQAEWKKQNKALPRPERKAAEARFDRQKKRWVLLAATVDIGALFLFKYYAPLADGLNTALGLGLWRAEQLLVPLGISYYSLHLVSYLVDVYRTQIEAEKNPLRVVAFAGFFLCITQGPFGRYGTLMPQMDQAPPFSWARLWQGAQRMAWGYFQKMAVADRAALIVSQAFADPLRWTGAQLAFGMLAFAVQLYTDFAGYSNIVLGAGQVLGLTLPENFRQPFFSRNMSEFWQRWHITLGAWLKDYLFYPLLKSAPFQALGAWLKPRLSKKAARSLPTYLGLFLLWTTIGLWHGAGFQYVFGVGILQFCYIFCGELLGPALQRLNGLLGVQRFPRLWRVWQGLRCTLLMVVAWVFFQSPSFGQALAYLGHMVTGFSLADCSLGAFTAMGVNRMGLLMLAYGVALVLAVDLAHERGLHLRERLAQSPAPVRGAVWQLALWSMVLLGIFLDGGTGSFLYARF